MSDAMDKLVILYKTNIKKVLLTDLVEDYMNAFEQQFNDSFGRYRFPDYDKTAPAHIKGDVFKYVRTSLVSAVQAMDPTGKMHLSAIDLDVFSRPDMGDTDSLRLFHFYLYGTPGTYVSISQDMYKKIFSSRGSGVTRLGRFGTMFMMGMDTYQKLYKKGNGSTKGWPTPTSIKHPFSGAPPVRIFETVWAKIEKGFDKYTKKAMDLTTKS